MITFILGDSGTGKTYSILNDIRRELQTAPDGPPLLFILPEQATFQAEQAILSDPGVVGMTRCRVLSFRRLAYCVFDSAGLTPKEPLSEVGRLLLLQRACREVSEGFNFLPREMGYAGLTQAARTVFEFLGHGYTPESLRKLAARTGKESVRLKLEDLALLLKAYLSQADSAPGDPDLVFSEMLNLLEAQQFFKGARVWVDGFAELSGQERMVLRCLARQASDLKISLLFDPHDSPGAGFSKARPFAPVNQTYNRLVKDFEEEGLQVGPPVVLNRPENRFGKTKELLYVAENIFRGRQDRFEGPVKAIEINRCSNPRKEAEFASGRILQLVQREGLRFRDIAVIVRNLEVWRDLLSCYLSEHGIPFFMDRRRSLQHHPLVELLRALGDALIEDFSVESVRRLLKTELTGLTRRETDILENHILCSGTKGGLWWRRDRVRGIRELLGQGEGESTVWECEELRNKFAERFSPWRKLQASKRSIREWASQLYRFVRELGALERLYEWAEEAEMKSDLDKAEEHRQAAEKFAKLLDEVARTAGPEKVSVLEFFKFFSLGLSAWDIALTPPTLDQVLVGSIDRSRHPELKAVLLLGLNDGVFPQTVQEDPLLPDRDREVLAKAGYEGGGASEEKIRSERLLAYVAFTRASERLYISCSEKASDGKQLFPSTFLLELLSMFRNLKERKPDDSLQLATTRERAAEAYIRAKSGKGDTKRWEKLLRYVNELAGISNKVEAVLEDAAIPAPAPEEVACEGGEEERKTVPVSVTELETFAQCPFRHLAKYRLRLCRRETFDLGVLELGVLRHRIMEKLGLMLIERGKSLPDLREAEQEKLLKEASEAALGKYGRPVSARDPLMTYLCGRTVRELSVFLERRRFLESKGSWRPLGVELSFGPESRLPALVFTVGERDFALGGKIDRVDWTESEEGKAYLCIYDFKTNAYFYLDTCYYGLSLQLPLYMLAVKDGCRQVLGRDGEVCGALLQSTRAKLESVDSPQEAGEDKFEKHYRPRGLITVEGLSVFEPEVVRKGGRSQIFQAMIKKDGGIGRQRGSDLLSKPQLQALILHIRGKTEEHLYGISRGKALPAPAFHRRRSACRWCEFASVCRFDRVIDRNRYRVFPKRSNVEILDQLED